MNNPERIFLAAQGYRELGMHSHALQELNSLPGTMQHRTDVLEIRVFCLMGVRQWSEALQMALKLREAAPKAPGGYIHSAYCLHELGRTEEALEMLMDGPASLRGGPLFYYNAACYHARLGRIDEALKMLEKSFELDPTLRKSAKNDPDLEMLKSKL